MGERPVGSRAASCAGLIAGRQPGFIMRAQGGQEACPQGPRLALGKKSLNWNRKGRGYRVGDHLPPTFHSTLSSNLCPVPD